ncbi:MAG: hypothetical protein K0U93_25645, partial [Gammaproteobacteria bacterium]|nr:hypothetical protein [Gammaproteobacteria bacterium]
MLAKLLARSLTLGRSAVVAALATAGLHAGPAQAELIGIGNPGAPSAVFRGIPNPPFSDTGISYDVGSSVLGIDTTVLAFTGFGAAQPPGTVEIQAQVASDGTLLGGVPGDDVVVRDSAGNVLLTGEVIAFGFRDSPGTIDDFDFRVSPTGGSAIGSYGTDDIGISVAVENSSFSGTFDNSINSAVSITKGTLGTTPSVCIDVEKEVSIDGGVTWADADGLFDGSNQNAFPVVAAPGSALYRMTVTNC